LSEKLIIRNFGPIKEMNLDLGKVTILIGEQASGKSTVAKVLCICRYFSYLVEDSNEIIDYRSKFSRTALREWGLEGFETDDSTISYENEDYSVVIDQHPFTSGDEISFLLFKPTLTAKSERFKKLLELLNELKPKEFKYSISADWFIPSSFLTSDVKSVMNNPFYFPTERGLQSIFSLGKQSLQNLDDSLYNQFALLDRITKEFSSETDIEPLNIKYRNDNGNGFVKKENEDSYYRLSNGASGYKSAIPIVLAVDFYSIINRKRTFIVEEPEQNLFPVSQKKLIDFLTKSVIKDGHQMLLTTHSPYILSAIENLMYAHKLGNIADRKYADRVEKVINKKYWIDQKDVSVYSLGNGVATDIVLRDEPLIDKEYIDSVSDVINAEFDSLLSIDVEHENGEDV